MHVLLIFVLILISIVMLIWGGNLLIDCAINIGKCFGISQVVVGATLVSIITMLPKIVVSIYSSLNGYEGMAVGNAFGSMAFNFLFIVGLLLCFKNIKLNLAILKSKINIYIILLALLFCFSLSGRIEWLEGCLLFLLFVFFYMQNYKECKNYSLKFISKQKIRKNTLILDSLFLLLTGSILIVFGAKILVDNSIKLVNYYGICEAFLGYTLISIGTSVPELITGIISIKKNCIQMAIGNIIGVNILCGTLLISLPLLFDRGVVKLSKTISYMHIPLLILGFLILYLMMKKYKKDCKIYGIFLILLYIITVSTVLI